MWWGGWVGRGGQNSRAEFKILGRKRDSVSAKAGVHLMDVWGFAFVHVPLQEVGDELIQTIRDRIQQ